MSRPSEYSEQFRRDAVELVLSGRSLRKVGLELNVNRETLRSWVNAVKVAENDSASPSERRELRRLRKRVAKLELENEILRKAAALYFAKEMSC